MSESLAQPSPDDRLANNVAEEQADRAAREGAWNKFAREDFETSTLAIQDDANEQKEVDDAFEEMHKWEAEEHARINDEYDGINSSRNPVQAEQEAYTYKERLEAEQAAGLNKITSTKQAWDEAHEEDQDRSIEAHYAQRDVEAHEAELDDEPVVDDRYAEDDEDYNDTRKSDPSYDDDDDGVIRQGDPGYEDAMREVYYGVDGSNGKSYLEENFGIKP